MTTNDQPTSTGKEAPKKKRLMPRPRKPEPLEQTLKRIHEQYGEALRRLAQ